MASTLPITDFSGGWNPRDAWSQVADNESPDMLNVTLDQRGGIMKRLGLTKVNGADQIVNTGNVQSLYYSSALDKIIAQVGADLYVSSDGGATWCTSIKTCTTSERCHMVDFLGKVVIGHPTDKKTCPHDSSAHVVLSGTAVRNMLVKGEIPPREFTRPEIAEILINAYHEGNEKK